MGLGILFVGYFLLLNFAYYSFTDSIAAAVILYASYKLSRLNSGFKVSFFTSLAFLVFGLGELILSVISAMMFLDEMPLLYDAISIVRYALIFILTFFILRGIRELEAEVDLPELAKKCTRNIYLSASAYALNIVLQIEALSSFVDIRILAVLYIVAIIWTLIVIVLNLLAIYGAYLRIYIPSESVERESTIGFIRDFKAHEEERQREYAEYQLEKLKERAEKEKEKAAKKAEKEEGKKKKKKKK